MNWLERLATLLGLTVDQLTGEGVDFDAAVSTALRTSDDITATHTALHELFVEMRALSEAADADVVEQAQADAMTARNVVVAAVAEQNRRNVLLANAAVLADADDLTLPEAVTPEPAAETAITTEDDTVITAPDQVDVNPELVAASNTAQVPVFFPQSSIYQQEIIPAGPGSVDDVARVLAAHGFAGGTGVFAEVPFQIATNAALAEAQPIAAACGDAAIGSCQFPVISESTTDCFDLSFASAVVTVPFDNAAGRRPGQALERRRPAPLDEGGFLWDSASYSNLFDLTDPDNPVLKTGAALDAALKQCRTWACQPTVPVKPVKIGDCISCYPNDADPETLAQKRRELDANIVRNTANALHDFMFANADWRTFAPTEASNAWASLTQLFGAIAGRNYLGRQLASPGFWVLGPQWLMALLEQENPLRSTAAPAGEWTELLATLSRMGGTYVGASQGFGVTNSASLTGAGTSTWVESLSAPAGTFAAPTALDALPSQIPLFFIPKGGLRMETLPFVRYGFQNDTMPLDTNEQRGNCLSLFAENEVMFDVDNCRPIVAVTMCVDPQAVGRLAVAGTPVC